MRNLSDRIESVQINLENDSKELLSILQEDTSEYKDEYIDRIGEIALTLKKLAREL